MDFKSFADKVDPRRPFGLDLPISVETNCGRGKIKVFAYPKDRCISIEGIKRKRWHV